MAGSPLLVALDRLSEDEPLALSFTETLPAFSEVLRSVAESNNAEVIGKAELQLESWPQRVDITGRIEVRADTTCARCLTRFPLKVERPIVHILVRSLERLGGDEEVELTSADLDRSLLTGPNIDLAEVLREELLLGMPMKAVCADECKGICSGCGVDLNSEQCICKPVVDERWSALAALKTPADEGDGS